MSRQVVLSKGQEQVTVDCEGITTLDSLKATILRHPSVVCLIHQDYQAYLKY